MSNRRVLGVIIIFLLIGSSIIYTFYFNPTGNINKAKTVEKFVVYYGEYNSNLAYFDVVIVPPTYEESEVKSLVSKGVVVLGYLSLTTVGGWEPWAVNVTSDLIIANYSLWGEVIVNVSSPKWRDIVFWAVDYINGKGYSGVFLDNLDMVDLYPWMRDSVVDLVDGIKNLTGVVCVNRGFTLLDSIVGYVDFVLYESFGSSYNFETGEYYLMEGEELAYLRNVSEKLRVLSDENGFQVLALGYANLTDRAQLGVFEDYVNSLADCYGFIPYVADISLMNLNLDYAKYSTVV